MMHATSKFMLKFYKVIVCTRRLYSDYCTIILLNYMVVIHTRVFKNSFRHSIDEINGLKK